MASVSGAALAEVSLTLSLLDTPVTRDTSSVSDTPGQTALAMRLGEALSLRLELINSGTTPVDLLGSVQPVNGMVRFVITDPDGTERPATSARWEGIDVALPARTLQPGESLTAETYLYAGLAHKADGSGYTNAYMFPLPGTYEVHAYYKSPTHGITVTSNTVTVTVGDPIDNWAELQAAGILRVMEGGGGTDMEHAVHAILAGNETHPLTAWMHLYDVAPALAAALVEDIKARINALLADWAAGDGAAVGAYLAADFLYEGMMDSAHIVNSVNDDIGGLIAGGLTVTIQATDYTVAETAEGDIAVTAAIVLTAGAQQQQQTVRFVLRNAAGTWLVRRWDKD